MNDPSKYMHTTTPEKNVPNIIRKVPNIIIRITPSILILVNLHFEIKLIISYYTYYSYFCQHLFKIVLNYA